MITLLGIPPLAVPVPRSDKLGAYYRHLAYRWRRSGVQRRKVNRITRELESCTDRELGDLGLTRADIAAVARGTYRRC